MKKKLWFALLVIVLLSFSVADAAVLLRPLTKDTYPMEDTILSGVEPNVLFLLDVGSAMTFTPKGQMPVYNYSLTPPYPTVWPQMADGNYRAGLLNECTYGVGGRPHSSGAGNTYTYFNNDFLVSGDYTVDLGNESSVNGYSRYGADKDSSNNQVGNIDDYYSPDPKRPYLLTFKDKTKAETPLGDPIPSYTNNDLVPNDSRMYQMKLVLWRLLSEENQQILSKMRVGMAHSYQEDNYPYSGYSFDFYRNSPFRDATPNYSVYHAANGIGTPAMTSIPFPHGTAPFWSMGSTGSGNYGGAQTAYGGIDNSNYLQPLGSVTWRTVNRAIMKVPFDYLYVLQNDGKYAKTRNLTKFREYIDGIEQGNGSIMTNPELVADGKTPLATSIFGRLPFKNPNNNADVYIHVNATNDTLAGLAGYSKLIYFPKTGDDLTRIKQSNGNSYVEFQRIKNSEGFMGGQAAGSVIDFFSPRTQDLAWNAGAENVNTQGFFPITGSCQANWLVIFTAGNDDIPGYVPEEAVRRLYQNSKQMRGRRYDGSKWVDTTFDMDFPIRTLVVGFVEPPDPNHPDDPNEPDQVGDSPAKILRKVLYRMAEAGNPGVGSLPKFADNVPGLIEALKGVLLQIYSDRFATGAPVVMPMYVDEKRQNVIFTSSYLVNAFDQWPSFFYKFVITDGVTHLAWEADKELSAQGIGRNVFTTTERENQTGGPTIQNIRNINDSTTPSLLDLARIPQTHTSEFINWMLKYDSDGASGVLGDMEHAGLTVVGTPVAQELLDISSIASRDHTVYLQTNRGILHALNYETGKEVWGFIPPNIFQNRIKELKFTDENAWYDGNGENTTRSRPMALLDGMLVAKDVRGVDGNYKTLMIGSQGWGGNGFYAMDVTEIGSSSRPKFLWAIDNARYADQEPVLQDGVKRWGAAATNDPVSNEYDYSDLGLTVLAAEMLSLTSQDVGVIPGGVGYKLGEGGDTQGKVFYIFNPEDASIIKKIDTASVSPDFQSPAGYPLGMGVTPITYIDNYDTQKTIEFYTGDSEGNIFFCDTTKPIEDWGLRSVFQLRTVEQSATNKSAYVSPDLPVAIPKALLVAETKVENDWIFAGTSDLMVPDTSETRKLSNAQQFVLGFNLTKISGDVANLDSLVPLKYIRDDQEASLPPYGDPYVSGDNVISADANGWYLKLRPKMLSLSVSEEATEQEYVTTDPFLYYEVLYVSTFIPYSRKPDDNEKCPELGVAKLYLFNPLTGEAILNDGKQQAITLLNVKISGISALDGKLYFGVKELKRDAALNVMQSNPHFSGLQRLSNDSSVLMQDAWNYKPDDFPDEAIRVPHLQYWRDSFR